VRFLENEGCKLLIMTKSHSEERYYLTKTSKKIRILLLYARTMKI